MSHFFADARFPFTETFYYFFQIILKLFIGQVARAIHAVNYIFFGTTHLDFNHNILIHQPSTRHFHIHCNQHLSFPQTRPTTRKSSIAQLGNINVKPNKNIPVTRLITNPTNLFCKKRTKQFSVQQSKGLKRFEVGLSVGFKNGTASILLRRRRKRRLRL
jgi:hypothetical protein